MKAKKREPSKDFQAGFDWGRGKARDYRRTVEKMSATCDKYATDKTLKGTKKGKTLNYYKRQFYKGASVGLLYDAKAKSRATETKVSHFANERKYSKSELNALLKNVDDIEF